jgi:hypothetical protein
MKVEMRRRAATANLPTEPAASGKMRPRHIPLPALGTLNIPDGGFPFLRLIGDEILAGRQPGSMARIVGCHFCNQLP